MNKKNGFIGIGITIIGAVCCAFIYFCEKMQLIPLTVKGKIGRLGIAALAGGLFFAGLYLIIQKAFRKISKKEWLPIILISLIASVCVMVWFPVPNTGLFDVHELRVRVLPDETGIVRPVTLTWLHIPDRDIPLSSVACGKNCSVGELGVTLTGENADLVWQGITGNSITIEFVADEDQGIAEISWDGNTHIQALNHLEMNRLSLDFTFPPSNGMPEFVAVWYVSFIICLAGIIAGLKMLPHWSIRNFYIGAFLCFVIFRIIQFQTVSEPLIFIDSESYLGMSEMPIMDILRGTPYCHEQFWYCIARPAFIPLIYKLCHQDLTLIPIIQMSISIVCWGFYAWQAAAICSKDNRKKAVMILTFGLGCVPNVTRWDQVIMSESLSISAALLLMGSCFWLVRPNEKNQWRAAPALCTAISTLLYAQSRDSAAWIVILIIILLLFLNRLRSRRVIIFILCELLTVICWFVMGNTGGRWQYPFENVLFNRIVRDPQGEEFFIESGMPTPSRLKELYGVEHMMGSELFNSEEMAPLKEWILSDGLKTYIRYMLRKPSATLRMAWYGGFEKEAFEQIDYRFSPSGFKWLLPDPVIKLFSCNLPGLLIIGLSLAGIWVGFHRQDGIQFSFPVLFVLSSYILCSGVLIADEYEFARHSMVILIMMKAAAWPMIMMLTEVRKERLCG